VAYEVETPDVDKMASNSCLKGGEPFPETTRFMKAMQEQVISINNSKEYVLKEINITDCICSKCREKLEII
jgi:hypothetical protein